MLQATAAATLPVYSDGAAATPASHAPQQPYTKAYSSLSPVPVGGYTAPMQPYAPVSVYGAEAAPQPSLVYQTSSLAHEQYVPQPAYQPAPVQYQV